MILVHHGSMSARCTARLRARHVTVRQNAEMASVMCGYTARTCMWYVRRGGSLQYVICATGAVLHRAASSAPVHSRTAHDPAAVGEVCQPGHHVHVVVELPGRAVVRPCEYAVVHVSHGARRGRGACSCSRCAPCGFREVLAMLELCLQYGYYSRQVVLGAEKAEIHQVLYAVRSAYFRVCHSGKPLALCSVILTSLASPGAVGLTHDCAVAVDSG